VVRTPLLLALIAGALALPVGQASAATAPQVEATWVTGVTATSAVLRAEVNPGGETSFYRFEYITLAAYEANAKAAKAPFSGAGKVPLSGSGGTGSDSAIEEVKPQPIGALSPASTYRFRIIVTNSVQTVTGPERSFATQAPTNAFALLDNRGWEMVSPIDKNGGAVQAPEAIFGGGVFQAAANGQSLTYSSADSFGQGAQGAPAGSQYLATHSSDGWQTQNITTPLLSGSYGSNPDGVPFQLFSGDLSHGLLSNGQRCRGQVGECPVPNPPLPGSAAVAGYRDYYLRSADGSFKSLLTAGDLTHTSLGPEQFELDFVGSSEDLARVVLSSCAALTSTATEVAAPGGCAATKQNLYEWSGSGLTSINLLPGDTQGTPGASIAALAGAISTDADRVYWSEAGNLYLREGTQTKQVDEAQGGGGVFQTASADGRFGFFTKAEHLYRYDATTEVATDLTPSGALLGVLGASADATKVYYLSSSGLFLWSAGVTTEVGAGADAAALANYPPSTGTARVSADGAHLLFLSAAELSGYESNGQTEAFLYGPPPGGGPAKLSCVSCNPTGERPEGGASLPGAISNGQGEAATRTYKPRSLSANANRVFFNSSDDLAIQDSNEEQDVYEWEAQGEGNCTREGGCVQLISSGRGSGPSSFIDASTNGSDAFFLTNSSLAFGDPSSYDLYDAREGGGFPVPPNAIPCAGDACQALPEAPEDPTPGTLVAGPDNPARSFVKPRQEKQGKAKGKKHKKKHHHKHGAKK
jgi:hypothetical protein